jgi:hypothetical protein
VPSTSRLSYRSENSILSIGSFGSVASVLSALSDRSLMSFRTRDSPLPA